MILVTGGAGNWPLFYDNQVLDTAPGLKHSPRGELEITDINRLYLELDQLNVQVVF